MKFTIAGRHRFPPVDGAIPVDEGPIWTPEKAHNGPHWTVEVTSLEQLLEIIGNAQRVEITKNSSKEEPEIDLEPVDWYDY